MPIRKPYAYAQTLRRRTAGSWLARVPWGRVALVACILAGLVYSLSGLFRDDDPYLSVEELMDDRRYKEAETLVKKLQEKDPDDVRTLRLLGRASFLRAYRTDHVKEDQTEEGWELYKTAVESLKKAIKLDKRGLVNSEDYMILGASYLKKGDAHFPDALTWLKEAESRATNDRALTGGKDKFFSLGTLYELVGYLSYRTGDFKQALAYYGRANATPKVLNFMYLGLAWRNLKEYERAIEAFTMVLDYANTKPLKTQALNNLGWLHFQLGRCERARAIYETLVAHDATFAEGWYWLGKIAERDGDQERALELWKKSLAVDPHFGPALLRIKSLGKKAK